MDEQSSKSSLDSNLIGRYLAGEASPEEVIVLEDWLNNSASNKLLFDQYLTTWNMSNTGRAYLSPNKTAAWRRLNGIISGSQKPARSPRKFFTPYRIAAVIAGIAILSIIPLLFFSPSGNRRSKNDLVITSVQSIKENKLPDGSSVVLNSNSTVSMPEQFHSSNREVELKGEAFFSIVPDPSRPFRIRYQGVSIEVVGTSFNVSSNEQEGHVETQVRTGKVKMYNGHGQLIISAGQTGVYDTKKNSFSIKDDLQVNSFSYATRNFIFSDEELGSIISYLEKAYLKKIVLKSPGVAKCKMTSSFDNKSIEYILDVIATTLDITYEIKNDIIYIDGGDHEGC